MTYTTTHTSTEWSTGTNVPTTTAESLRRLLDEPAQEVAVLDVRTPKQRIGGHIALSTVLPFHNLEQGISLLVPRRETPVVVVSDDPELDRAGVTALVALGYSDVTALAGGTAAWAVAGERLYTGTNVRSKTLGEWIEHEYGTPTVDPATVARWRAAGEGVVVLDSRPRAEYRHHHIPDGLDTGGGAELAFRGLPAVPGPETRIVVNCAGRTRGIVGAQSLVNTGIPNPVYSLHNGTPAWGWAGLPVEAGEGTPLPIPAQTSPELRSWAQATLESAGVRVIGAAELDDLRAESRRTLYLIDVRSPEETTASTVAGARPVQGGQLVQGTDEHLAVRRARVVLVDTEDLVRAASTVQWLRFLHDGEIFVVVHDPALEGPPARSDVPLPQVPQVSPKALAAELTGPEPERPLVLDLRHSTAYRQGHLPGSVHARREHLPAAVPAGRRVVLVGSAADLSPDVARDLQSSSVGNYLPHFAAADLLARGVDVAVLDGDPAQVPVGATADAPRFAGEVADLTGPPPAGPERDAWYREYFEWEYSLVPASRGDRDFDFEGRKP